MAAFDFAQILDWLETKNNVSGQALGFRHDSRDVIAGDLLFALKGEKVDGHDYLRQAAEKGAVGAVVSKAYQGESFGLPLIYVDNVLASLHKLAKKVRQTRTARIVAVTGSVGKTTTKEFIATLLEGKFRVGKTPGNSNSQVTVPLSILNAKGDEEIFVIEMGMTCPHEIERLVDIAPPEVAVITKIALAHAAFFPDGLDGIAAAKAEILSHSDTRVAILNHQAMGFSVIQKSRPLKVTYGREEDGAMSDFVLCSEGENFIACEKEGRTSPFPLPFSATHLCENFIGAAAAARAMGIEWPEILLQAQKLTAYKRRFERVEKEGIIFINDAYNANLTSMKAALANLPVPAAGKKRIGVLGAMKELGTYTEHSHYEAARFALSHIDHLLCLGEECLTMIEVFQSEGKPAEYFHDFAEIKKRVYDLAEEGDVVLLKGSNSKKLWELLE